MNISFEEFLAEIQTIFQNYADTNDLDTISIKGWVIDKLRMFGKNICEQREMIVGVENSRALLPENFKSVVLALKLDGEIADKGERYREIPYKKYITNDVVWDEFSQTYVKDNCQSQVVIEKLIIDNEPIERYMNYQPLSVVKGVKTESFDIDCYNLHPEIRQNYPYQISITNRTLNTNFKRGLVYLSYNSLPEIDGEIAIPIISTGDIYNYLIHTVKIRIAENLLINNKNGDSLKALLQLWLPQERILSIQARSEANFYGLGNTWQKKMYKNRMQNLDRFNLPK